jgi:hypothetical protein
MGMDPIMHSKLYVKVRGKLLHAEFITLIEVLHEIGAIQRFTILPDGKGRPAEYIRGTNLLLSGGLGETVLDRLN